MSLPIWVRLGSRATQSRLPLFPQQQTLLSPAVTSVSCHDQTSRASFDHLVGAAEQREWHCEAERLGGLEVYEQLNFRRLHDRQVGRLHASENFPGISTEQTVIFRFIASVAD